MRTARMLGAFGAVTFMGLGFVLRDAGFDDDLRFRSCVTALMLVCWAATYISDRVRRHLHWPYIASMALVTAHSALLMGANRLHPTTTHAVPLVLVIFAASAAHMLQSRAPLAAYLVFSNLCMIAAATFARDPLTSPALLLCGHGALTIAVYITVSGQIRTVRRLVESRSLLEDDIARRERVEAALRESERRAQGLLEAIPDVLLRVRRDGTVRELANAGRHPLGSYLGELEGRALEDLSAQPSVVRSALEQAFDTGSVACAACAVRGTDGKQFAELRAVATNAEEALVVVRDVTQERGFEERLRTSDRLVALGTLASGIAHEINNPLSYVAGNVSYAIDEIESRDGAAELHGAVTALRESLEGAERIGNIVAGLKQFTAADGDALGVVDLNETIESALRMMKAQLSFSTSVELDLGQLPKVRANATQLLQVILNLVSNALQALPDRPKHENSIQIGTSVGDSSQDVVLTVRDNGVGIADAHLGRIFDPFYTTKSTTLSTGLGLYLCQRFVTSFGGSIAAESRTGEGALLRVTLRPAAQQQQSPKQAADARVDTMRVLIVDDEPLVARSISRMLKGCNTTVACGGGEALELCAHTDFDMILCDMMMPGMDGAQFFDALRSARPHLLDRVVFMTGGAFNDEAMAFLASQSKPWLQKPVRREWLLDIAQRLKSPPAGTSCPDKCTLRAKKPALQRPSAR